MTTNTENTPGRHRTDEPFGVVIKAEPHRRGWVDRSAGQINIRSWGHLTEAARADAEFRREYRARRADLDASLARLANGV